MRHFRIISSFVIAVISPLEFKGSKLYVRVSMMRRVIPGTDCDKHQLKL